MGVRLLTSSEVDRWQSRLADGMAAAGVDQHAAVGAALRSHGLEWSSPTGAPVVLWSDGAWAKAVTRHVEPAARAVAADIVATLDRRTKGRFGSRGTVTQLAGMVTDRAIQGGPYISGRLGLTAAGGNIKAISRALDDAAKVLNPGDRRGGIPTVADEFQARLSQLGDLAANVAGPMANAATTMLAEAQAQAGNVTYSWNCAMIPTSRQDHIDADGQIRPAGEPFSIGGELLDYPGDPSGSDEQTCNCLCWLETTGIELADDLDLESLDG